MAGEVQRKDGMITLPIKIEQVDVCCTACKKNGLHRRYCLFKLTDSLIENFMHRQAKVCQLVLLE